MNRFLAALLLSPAIALAATPPGEIAARRDAQAQIQADTDQLARRIATMLRVMEHYKLDKQAETKVLEEAAGALSALSRDQMGAVLEKLDAAAAAADAEASKENVDAAYAGHREALRRLKGLLANYDAVRTLEQAAVRLEKSARDELEMSFRVADIVIDSVESSNLESTKRRFKRVSEFPTTRARREGEEQADYRKEIEVVLRQIAKLKPALPPAEGERLSRAESALQGKKFLEQLDQLTTRMRTDGDMGARQREWVKAQDGQWSISGDFLDVARMLAPPQAKLPLLREARQRLGALCDEQARAAADAVDFFAKPPPAPEPPQPGFRGRLVGGPDETVLIKSREFADGQGRMAYAARGLSQLLAADAPAVAAPLSRAVRSMQAANAALRQTSPIAARMYQAWTEAQLRLALGELDLAVTKAVQEKTDPLAAAKAALEKVEKLIDEQKAVRAETEKNIQTKNDEAAKHQSPKQQALADQGEELAKAPLPVDEPTRDALKDAAAAMKNAGEKLNEKQTKPAEQSQDRALAKLDEAQKALAEKVAALEQRKDDITKLQDAQKQLGELRRAERKVAEEAEAAAAKEKSDSQPAAAAQEKLTPPTKDVSKKLEEVAPDAAKSASQAAEKMQSAQKNLDQAQAKEGAKDARDAAKELEKARDQVTKALDEKRAQDAADQAKLQPNLLDAIQAAREVAKALESAEEAGKSSEQAAQNPASQELAKKQREVADKAQEMKQDAAAPADAAAKKLSQGDLDSALAQQKKALEQLQKPEAGDLARDQKQIMEATKSLSDSQQANQQAMEAVQQAMAQAPGAIQQQLDEAAKQLKDAAEQLKKTQPKNAGDAQAQAAQALGQALSSLEAAAEELAKNPPPGGLDDLQGDQPGDKPGQKPGQKPTQNPGKEQASGDGDRTPDGKLNNARAQLTPGDGDGSFLHLPPRQRELIRQAMSEKLPPDYATLIQQYYVNVAKGKPAAGNRPQPK